MARTVSPSSERRRQSRSEDDIPAQRHLANIVALPSGPNGPEGVSLNGGREGSWAMTKWRNLVVAGVMLATGCGSARPTAASLAAKLNEAGVACQGLTVKSDVAIGREQGTCASGADLLTIDTFDTNQVRDTALMGNRSDAAVVVGDRWYVTVESVTAARRVQTALGGKLA